MSALELVGFILRFAEVLASCVTAGSLLAIAVHEISGNRRKGQW